MLISETTGHEVGCRSSPTRPATTCSRTSLPTPTRSKSRWRASRPLSGPACRSAAATAWLSARWCIEVGGAAETVNVTAEAPLIQAPSGERSFTVTTASVENLPLSNRNFASLTPLAPGVTGTTTRLGGGGQNNIMMDGVSTMDTGNNGQMLQMNVEAIAEVKVLTSGYQAEYGRSSGLQITAVTKSGTNRFRGSVYDVERNSDWNENSWANVQERHCRRRF